MRIIFLNSWYGKVGKEYFNFIKESSKEADILCLNEVSPDLFSKLQEILPDHKGFYEQGIFDITMDCIYGQAIFVKKDFPVENLGRIETFKNTPTDIGYAVVFKLNIHDKKMCLVNVHGKARPGHKLDTPERIGQSQKIINFLKDRKEPIIIGGDFNLMPETKSVQMFESAGYKNLIKEFSIKNTRNRLCWKQFPEEVKKNGKQFFADYCFVSPEVKVKNFEVPNIEVSDHLPLILDFEV